MGSRSTSTMIANLKLYLAQESFAVRRERMLLAAGYGALIASAYAWSMALVNVLSFLNLPLGIDLPRTLTLWAGFVTGAALLGAVSAWFTEEYEGIIGGAVIGTILLLIFQLAASIAHSNVTPMLSVLFVLQLIGAVGLGAWILSWAARRHVELAGEKQRGKLMQHVLILTLIGLVPGLLGRLDYPAVQSIDEMNKVLLTAPTDTMARARLPLDKVPGLESHFGMGYRLYARQSAQMVGNLDVTVRYTDGYAVTCSLLRSTSGATFITDCREGSE